MIISGKMVRKFKNRFFNVGEIIIFFCMGKLLLVKFLLGKLLLGKLLLGKLAVGEVALGKVVLGKLRWVKLCMESS